MSLSDCLNFFVGAFGLVTAGLLLFAWQVARKENKVKDEVARKLERETKAKILVLEITASDAKSAQQSVEIELNKTKIQLARTQDFLAPRRIDPAEQDEFVRLMKSANKPGKIRVIIDASMPAEAQEFAHNVYFALKYAGYDVERVNTSLPTHCRTGFHICTYSASDPRKDLEIPLWARQIGAGFARIGHPAEWEPDPTVLDNSVTVAVGKRPDFLE